MSGKKNNRQRQRRQQAARQARARALATRQRQEQKKKRTALVAVALGLIVVVLLAVSLSASSDEGTDLSTSSSSTSTPPPDGAQSAAGLPCVEQATPSPSGAPTVPVKVGPPPTSLVVEDLKPGTGPEVPKDATITVNYIGVSCSSGAVFDSSYKRGKPATFPLTGVIKGWTDGIPGMKVGGQRLLGIPGDQAYGPEGRPPDILGDEALWFVIEVVSIGS